MAVRPEADINKLKNYIRLYQESEDIRIYLNINSLTNRDIKLNT